MEQFLRRSLESAALRRGSPPLHLSDSSSNYQRKMKDRVKKWFLFTGNRYSVAGGILLLMTGVGLSPLFPPFTMRNTVPLFYLTSTLVGGNLTLITLVVAINQVVLSQELESPGSLRDEIERTAEYRQEALGQPTAPTDPSDFIHQLLQQTQEHVDSLEELLPNTTNEAASRLLTDLPEHCEQAIDQLEPTSEKLSTVIVPLLGIDYADYIYDSYQLRSNHDEESHEELFSALDCLSADLENLDIARQYFTTVFMKKELATLSRSLLYVGVIAISIPLALLYQLSTYPGASPPMPELIVLTILVIVVGLLPLALLIVFVLRIAAIAHYIAAITPFQA